MFERAEDFRDCIRIIRDAHCFDYALRRRTVETSIDNNKAFADFPDRLCPLCLSRDATLAIQIYGGFGDN